MGAPKEGGDGAAAFGTAAFGTAAFGTAAGGAGVFFSSLLPPNIEDPKDGPVDGGGAAGALSAFFVAAL